MTSGSESFHGLVPIGPNQMIATSGTIMYPIGRRVEMSQSWPGQKMKDGYGDANNPTQRVAVMTDHDLQTTWQACWAIPTDWRDPINGISFDDWTELLHAQLTDRGLSTNMETK